MLEVKFLLRVKWIIRIYIGSMFVNAICDLFSKRKKQHSFQNQKFCGINVYE